MKPLETSFNSRRDLILKSIFNSFSVVVQEEVVTMPTINMIKADKMMEAIKILTPTSDLLNFVSIAFVKNFFAAFRTISSTDSVLQLHIKDQLVRHLLVFVLVILL